MSIFPDFNQIRKEQAEWRKEAKTTFVNGIDPADLASGMWVTVSPCLRTGDRSYSNELLKVIAVNACHVQVEFEKPRSYGATAILTASERHFYVADSFQREAVAQSAKP